MLVESMGWLWGGLALGFGFLYLACRRSWFLLLAAGALSLGALGGRWLAPWQQVLVFLGYLVLCWAPGRRLDRAKHNKFTK